VITLNGHNDRVFAQAFSPDGRLLASAGTYDPSLANKTLTFSPVPPQRNDEEN
jgi:WD40 repeat protein